MKIAHVSDLHFGDASETLAAALLNRLHELRPDLVIASGDFTMRGSKRQFEQAAAFIEDIPAPVLATPGNHDLPTRNLLRRFLTPLARYDRYIRPVTCSEYRDDHAAILSLNTARAWNWSVNWSHGFLSFAQLRQADAFFRVVGDVPFKALVVHHPFWVPETMPSFRAVANADAMLGVLAHHGVQAVFAGHLHHQFSTIRTVPTDRGDAPVTLIQASTAISSRTRGNPNAFKFVVTKGSDLSIKQETWDGERFRPHTPSKSSHIVRPYAGSENGQREAMVDVEDTQRYAKT